MKPALALIAEVVVPTVTEGVVAMVVAEVAGVAEVADLEEEGSEGIRLSGRRIRLVVVIVPAQLRKLSPAHT